MSSLVFVFIVLAGLVLVLAIYPGELSWLLPGGNRWLYDRAAPTYDAKCLHHDYGPYQSLVADSARELSPGRERVHVADLACGTGFATRSAFHQLGDSAIYVGVDYSAGMLQSFQQHIDGCSDLSTLDLTLLREDLDDWLQKANQRYDLVMLMEAAEFLPSFTASLRCISRLCKPGGKLLLTRPAGFWAYLFPGRHQTRGAMERALVSAGFAEIKFIPWRSRYELVSATRLVS